MSTSVNALRSSFRGSVLEPTDDEYNAFRQIWNGVFSDRYPSLIARCAGPADVIAAVNYARERGIQVAVKGGGHSLPGFSLPERGMMIDLSGMKSVRVDPIARTVRCEPGVLWADIDTEAHAFGLAMPGGTISHTGIAGLTLGGGFGWLSRKHGLVVDNLLSCDVVTADGKFIHARESENVDLFWGLRGGGGNFGIVTSFEYQLHPLARVLIGRVAYPLAEAKTVLMAVEALLREAPDELTAGVVIRTTSDGHSIIGVLPVYVGEDLTRGEELIAPFCRLGAPIMAQTAVMPYPALQRLIDDSAVPYRRYYVRSNFVDTWHPDLIDILATTYSQSPSPLSEVIINRLGGAVCRTPTDATAFAHRNAPYAMMLVACWEKAADDSTNKAWLTDLFEQLKPYLTEGAYVNGLVDEGVNRISAAYGPNLKRLQELKHKYDPANFFRLNQNIAPVEGTDP